MRERRSLNGAESWKMRLMGGGVTWPSRPTTYIQVWMNMWETYKRHCIGQVKWLEEDSVEVIGNDA